MNRKRLAALNEKIRSICLDMERFGASLWKAHQAYEEIDRKIYICDVLNIPEGKTKSIFEVTEELKEIYEEFKQYVSAPPAQDQGVRVVRFRGDGLQSPARADTTKIVMEVPTKALEKFVSKYGFEMFTDDLFDFCEREGW